MSFANLAKGDEAFAPEVHDKALDLIEVGFCFMNNLRAFQHVAKATDIDGGVAIQHSQDGRAQGDGLRMHHARPSALMARTTPVSGSHKA